MSGVAGHHNAVPRPQKGRDGTRLRFEIKLLFFFVFLGLFFAVVLLAAYYFSTRFPTYSIERLSSDYIGLGVAREVLWYGGLGLALLSLLLLVGWRINVSRNKNFKWITGCPNCHEHDLLRVQRFHSDRAVGRILFLRLMRFACRNCSWQGLLIGAKPGVPPDWLVKSMYEPEEEVLLNVQPRTTNEDDKAPFKQGPRPGQNGTSKKKIDEMQVAVRQPAAEGGAVRQDGSKQASPALQLEEGDYQEPEDLADTDNLDDVDGVSVAEPETNTESAANKDEEPVLLSEDLTAGQESAADNLEPPQASFVEDQEPEAVLVDGHEFLEEDIEEEVSLTAGEVVEPDAESVVEDEVIPPIDDKLDRQEEMTGDLEINQIHEVIDQDLEPEPEFIAALIMQRNYKVEETLLEDQVPLATTEDPNQDQLSANDDAAALPFEGKVAERAVVVSPFGLKLREEPHIDARVLMVLKPDEVVELLGDQDMESPATWRHVKAEQNSGWVSAAFLKRLNDGTLNGGLVR